METSNMQQQVDPTTTVGSIGPADVDSWTTICAAAHSYCWCTEPARPGCCNHGISHVEYDEYRFTTTAHPDARVEWLHLGFQHLVQFIPCRQGHLWQLLPWCFWQARQQTRLWLVFCHSTLDRNSCHHRMLRTVTLPLLILERPPSPWILRYFIAYQ